MPTQLQNVPVAAAELLGDLRPLMDQLGSPAGLAALAGGSRAGVISSIHTLADLREFLEYFQTRVLRPLELPAILRAFGHASRHEVRELVAFDQQISTEPLLQSLASASKRVGQAQLRRLRPLRDERTVQRYLTAIDGGSAQGWHTVVYGLTLAIYSIPLRQGLLSYAEQTTRSFIHSASHAFKISKPESQALFEELTAGLPAAVESLLHSELIAQA